MARPRWLSPWKDSDSKPSLYHVVSRVVDRRLAFGPEEKEKFRTLMRMMENFSGCRVLSYCLMSNHFHILLEVPPAPPGGIPDAALLERLRSLYPEGHVGEVGRTLAAAREAGDTAEVEAIRRRYSYRMHDLSEFMKGLLQRFSSWFNRSQGRTGRLWEQRFTSVLVESGTAARAVAAYIDLNPVRAGLCEDPADYRWSSYAEALAGVRKAQAGLVRAMSLDRDSEERESRGLGIRRANRVWAQGGLGGRYRAILLGEGVEVVVDGKVRRRGMNPERAAAEVAAMEGRRSDLAISRVIRHRIRYFSAGAVIGGREFVDSVFRECRERFGPRRRDGARKPRGALGELAGELWSARDLRKGVA